MQIWSGTAAPVCSERILGRSVSLFFSKIQKRRSPTVNTAGTWVEIRTGHFNIEIIRVIIYVTESRSVMVPSYVIFGEPQV
jgi:hypothetical protein